VQQAQDFARACADDGHESVAGGKSEGGIAIEARGDLDDEDVVARHEGRLHVAVARWVGKRKMAHGSYLRLVSVQAPKARLDGRERDIFIERRDDLVECGNSHRVA
jgi:hypothetical protein